VGSLKIMDRCRSLMTTNTNKAPSQSSLRALLIVTGIFLLSACAGNQSSNSYAPSSNTGAPTAGQPNPGSANNAASGNSAQAVAATPPPTVAPMPSTEHLAGIGSATVITVHGKILSVDRANKLVTLVGPRGKQVTLHVNNPYNLAAAKAGEPFVARFYEIITIRKKQPGESIPPASLLEGIATAAPGQTPGAVAGQSAELVETITAINRKKETLDLKGPDGVVETVKVANPANLKHVKVGDDIVVTLSRVIAISLDHETAMP
jgi:hypothetical protein